MTNGDNNATTVQVQNYCEDKKRRVKTRHVAGMNSFRKEKRIILNTNLFHLHLKIQTIALRRLQISSEIIIFLHDAFTRSIFITTWKLLGTSCFIKQIIMLHILNRSKFHPIYVSPVLFTF